LDNLHRPGLESELKDTLEGGVLSNIEQPYWNPVDTLAWIMYREPELLIGDHELDYLLPKNRGMEPILNLPQAYKELTLELQRGTVMSWGIHILNGPQVEVPPIEWTRLKIRFGFNIRSGINPKNPPEAYDPDTFKGPTWKKLVIRSCDVQKIWEPIESDITKTEPSPEVNKPTWIENARQLATSLLRDNSYENQMNLAEDVHAHLEKRGFGGRGGKIPCAGTIKRRALKGLVCKNSRGIAPGHSNAP